MRAVVCFTAVVFLLCSIRLLDCTPYVYHYQCNILRLVLPNLGAKLATLQIRDCNFVVISITTLRKSKNQKTLMPTQQVP